MAIYKPSKEEWQAYFPHSIKAPSQPQFNFITGSELQHARFASVSISVEVDKPWPGLPPLDDQNPIGSINFSIGRWYIDDISISCIGEGGEDYDIELARVLETDWIAHMLEKSWLYDPTDFLDVLEEARHTHLQKDKQQLDTILWQEISETLRRGIQPFFPSRLQQKQRVYLVNRMTEEERDAFCTFLVNEGYTFE